MSFYANLLVLVSFAAIFAACVRRNPQAFFPASVIFLFLLWQGVSVAYLETGKRSFELFTTTYQTGATLRLAAALSALFGAYWAGFELLAWHAKPPEPAMARRQETLYALFIGLLAFCAVLLYTQLPSGDALNSRNLFIATTPAQLRDLIFKYLPVMTFAAGLSAALSLSAPVTYASYLSVLGGVFVMTLFGHKFSGITGLLFPFCFPVAAAAIGRVKDKLYLRRHLALMSALMLLSAFLSISAFSKYLKVRQAGWEDLRPDLKTGAAITQDYLKIRLLVLQGGIWWVTDRNAVKNGERYTISEMLDYAHNMPYRTLAPSNAYLTEKAIGKERTKYLLEHYVQYASPSPAVFYSFAGRFGPSLLYALSGLLLALVAFYLVRKILLGHPLRAALGFTLYLPVYNFILGGELLSISPSNLALKLALLLALEKERELRAMFSKTKP